MAPLLENLHTHPTAASKSNVTPVESTSDSQGLHASGSHRDAPRRTHKRSSSLPRGVKVTGLDTGGDSHLISQASSPRQCRHEAPHTLERDIQDCFVPHSEEAYKSDKSKPTLPNKKTGASKDNHSLTDIDASGRYVDRAGVESPTTPRSSTFVRSAGNMPSSSPVQLQLWESLPSSSSNTLVGIPNHIREYLHGHNKTPSGSSSAHKSGRSSSEGHVEREDNQRRSTPVTGAEGSQTDKTAPPPDSSLPPIRYAPWADQDRPRSGSTIHFHPDLPGSRQQHCRHSSMLQLSPIMPLVFQPDLPLAMLRYTSRTAWILYTLYPLLCFAHVPLTLFLDVNVLYALVQIALHPTNETSTRDGDNIQGTPRSSPWWIAVGLYALSTFFWFFVVFLIHDLYYRHFKVWKNRNPPVIQVFSSAPSFHLSCTRSYNLFCALWRLRLSAFIDIGSLPPSRRQGIIETSYLFMQNWQTVITLVPRALISLLLLLSFTTTSSDATIADFSRDPAYFKASGTLSVYSIVFNFVSFLVLVAGVIYLRLRDGSWAVSPPRPSTPGDSYTMVSATWPAQMQHVDDTPQEWKRNLRERIIELVLLCSSANRWRTPRDNPNAYKQSSSIRHAASQSRRKRQSAVSPQSDEGDVPEMQERPLSSSLSFQVHLPEPAASTSNNGGIPVDEAGRGIRISSIPTRGRKKTVSTDSNASSIFSTRVDTMTSDSSHTVMERPFSALGHHNEQEHRYLLHSRTHSGASLSRTPIAEVLDEEELERLEWEKLAPLTPRGSLVQAREELAQQQKERSYWNSGSPTTSAALSFLDELPTTPADVGHTVERDLHAIVEESDEEASLRRANSLGNKQSVSSRQSSLRRAATPLNRLDDAGISIIEERSEHGQTASAG